VGYPNCDFKLWQKPVAEPCPNCAIPFLLRAGGEKNPKLMCSDKACGYSRSIEIETELVGVDASADAAQKAKSARRAVVEADGPTAVLDA